jgi:hypothetical protein
LPLAKRAIRAYQDEERATIEILFVMGTETGKPFISRSTTEREQLGLDVAGTAPFYSVVGDMPPELRTSWLPRLNEHGLFSEMSDALVYRDAYHSAENRETKLLVWQILAVQNSISVAPLQ